MQYIDQNKKDKRMSKNVPSELDKYIIGKELQHTG
jgi:hypothetical protein